MTHNNTQTSLPDSQRSRMHSPVFLVGTQRSGTTLLCRMLTAHPDVFIKNELPVRTVFKPGSDRAEIEKNIDHYVTLQYGKGIKALLKAEGKKIWGLKDPELTAYLEPLKQFLPEARFIIITRDGRAVVNSYMENAWGLGTNAYTGALRWRDEIREQLRFEREFPKQVLRLRYEDLVIDQETSLHRVCDFLGIAFDNVMLDYAGQKSFVIKSRENTNTFKAPDPELTRKWRQRLSNHEIRIVDSICRQELQDLGYELGPVDYKVPGWMALYYRLHQAVIGEAQIQYRWRIRRWLRSLNLRFRSLTRRTN